MKQDFPEVRDKIVETVELNVEAEFYGITIRFQDRTSLTFSIEPCVVTSPIYSQWTEEGEEKVIREYTPVRSEVPLTEGETEARLKES